MAGLSSRIMAFTQMATLEPRRMSWIAMSALAASSAIWAGGRFETVIPGPFWKAHCRTRPPADSAIVVRPPGSGVFTRTRGTGRGKGGAGTSSPRNPRARKRAAAPSFRTPGVEAAKGNVFTDVTTMKATAARASGRVASA